MTTASAHACRKCAGLSARRHHPQCPKRGLGHQGRGARARWIEVVGADWGVPVTVRRGRHGKGDSLPIAELRLGARMAVRTQHGTVRDLQHFVADIANVDPSNVEVAPVPSAGMFTITIRARVGGPLALRDIQTKAEEYIPGSLCVAVHEAPPASTA